jgi:hypothetical protein
MMIPPHLPRKPRGLPNIRIKIWLVTLISQTEMVTRRTLLIGVSCRLPMLVVAID